jgi:hypothetical protein
MAEMVVDRPEVQERLLRRQRRVGGLMRMASGLAWIVAPPIALLTQLIRPQLYAVGTPKAGTTQQQLALLAAHASDVMVLRVADYLFEVAIFIGWLAVIRLLWHRYPVLSLINGVLAVLGLTGAMGVVALETMRLQLAQSGDNAAIAAAYARLDSGPSQLRPACILP